MYTPKRDHRFEYIWELMAFIEENQCKGCALKSDRPEYPMCFKVEGEIIKEEPLAILDDRGNDGVFCNLFHPM